MIREFVDTAYLEDFVAGLSRSTGLAVAIYASQGGLLAMSEPASDYARQSGCWPSSLPRPIPLTRLAVDDPPASVAFIRAADAFIVVAPIYLRTESIGWIAVGEYRDGNHPPARGSALEALWAEMPLLSRGPDSHASRTARWASRLLSNRCRQEARLNDTAQNLSSIGDIAELLSGEQHLQRILDRIVTEAARVMDCPYASLRLYDEATDELRIKAAHQLSDEYAGRAADTRAENPIDDEALKGRTVYIEDAREDPRIKFPEEARRLGIVSGLTVGILYHGRPIGVIRVYTNRRRRFRPEQRNLMRALAAQAATAIVNAQLLDDRLRAAQVERDIELAGNLQARMVRVTPPAHERIEAALVFEPSWHVSGDFCDFFRRPNGDLIAAIADVVGHGVHASLLMTYVRGAMRATITSAPESEDLGDILTRLNRQICEETQSAEFVTLLVVAVDAEASALRFANAGHEPPLILRGVKKTIRPMDGGIVMGIMPEEVYETHTVPLHPNDFVLLYTDGLIESMNFQQDLFGRERLRDSLVRYGALRPETALKNILWDIRRFVGLAELTDDLTMVAMRVNGDAAESFEAGAPETAPATLTDGGRQ
ncbi:MAG: SpoIIE family protein phosphatase [Phycisphaerales bacterium]|nr:SpoIIE family protein phosphatase [Phycisphaerales bacterium]